MASSARSGYPYRSSNSNDMYTSQRNSSGMLSQQPTLFPLTMAASGLSLQHQQQQQQPIPYPTYDHDIPPVPTPKQPHTSPVGQSYRSFLTPARHSCFIRAVGPSFLACYVASFTMVDRSWWSLLPFKTLPLFLSVIAIFMVRLSRCHIGARTARSRSSELFPVFFSFDALMAIFWFGLSTWLYAEVYMWYSGESGGFNWIESGRPDERPWMNERPVIMRTVFLYIGIVKGFRHLYLDLDRIRFPARKFVKGKPAPLGSPIQRIRSNILSEIKWSTIWSFWLISSGMVLYYLFLRQLSWKLNFSILQKMLGLSRAYRPGRLRSLSSLLFRHCLVQAIICGLVLDFSSLCFTAYLTQPPFRNDKFLTHDGRDPNKSLIIGLRSRQELQRTSAFYELATIAHTVGARRKTIFTEIIDKKRTTSSWATISALCLEEITAISQRVNFARVQGEAPAVDTEPPTPVGTEFPDRLTKIVDPLNTDNIIRPVRRQGNVGATVDGIKAFHATSSATTGVDGAYSKLSNTVIKTMQDSGQRLITEIPQQPAVKLLQDQLSDMVSIFFASKFGSFFAQLPSRLVTTTVCTSPLSESGIVTDAVEALSRLCIASLEEDSFGRVFPTIPGIIRDMANVLVDLETFIADVVPDSTEGQTEPPVNFAASVSGSNGVTQQRPKTTAETHKLSPYFQPPQFSASVFTDSQLADVIAIRDCLREGLSALLSEVFPYWSDLKMSETEMKYMYRLVGLGSSLLSTTEGQSGSPPSVPQMRFSPLRIPSAPGW